MNHRFVIGIGSQRAGTTLLHMLLSKASNIFMHPAKELHYFDTLFGHRCGEALTSYSLAELRREIDHIATTSSLSYLDKTQKCLLRAYSILADSKIDSVNYIDLYRPLLSESTLLGEITPEYMLLDEHEVKILKETVGANATIILICRDPIERLISSAKLFNAYHNLNMSEDDITEWVGKELDKESEWIQAQDKYNDYYRAINTFSRHFSRFLAIDFTSLFSSPLSVAAKLSTVAEVRIDADQFATLAKHKQNTLGNLEIRSPALQHRLAKRYECQRNYLSQLFAARTVVTQEEHDGFCQ